MRRLKFPTVTELAIFAVMAVICAAVVSQSAAWDLAMAGLTLPVAITAGVLGLRSSGRLGPPVKRQAAHRSADDHA